MLPGEIVCTGEEADQYLVTGGDTLNSASAKIYFALVFPFVLDGFPFAPDGFSFVPGEFSFFSPGFKTGATVFCYFPGEFHSNPSGFKTNPRG